MAGDREAREAFQTLCRAALEDNLPKIRETLGYHPLMESVAISLVGGMSDNNTEDV